MRKISQQVYNAFISNKPFTSSNTRVVIEGENKYVYLFDNNIVKEEAGELYISTGEYPATKTTKERLSPFIPGINIRKLKDIFIINEKLNWHGEWLNIKDVYSI